MIPQYRLTILVRDITHTAMAGALNVLEGAPCQMVEAKLNSMGDAVASLGLGDMYALCWRGLILLQAAEAARTGSEYEPTDAELCFANLINTKPSEPLLITTAELDHMQAVLADRGRTLEQAGTKYAIAAEMNQACADKLSRIQEHLAVIEQQSLICFPSDHLEGE